MTFPGGVQKVNEDGSPKKSLVFLVEINGKQGKFRINKASREACLQAFGDETKKWIGREASCFVMPTPDGVHKMVVLDPIFKDGIDESWDK